MRLHLSEGSSLASALPIGGAGDSSIVTKHPIVSAAA
jgi:hypothetical protein